jgi:kinetochore protein Fta7
MPTKGRKRKSPSDEGEEPKAYAVLKPRIHYVGENTIRKRWATLPESSQSKVRELLRAGERPTIMIHRDERRRLEAQQAVNEVQRR